MKKSVYIKYCAALLLFGSNGIIADKIKLNSIETVFTRTLIGGLFLFIIWLFSKNKINVLHNKKDFLYIVLSGVSMGAGWIFLFEAYTLSGVGISTLLYYCGPAFLIITALFVFKEKFSAAKIIGFAAVIAGMLCLSGYSFKSGSISFGFFCGFMSALMYAFMVVFNKKASGIKGFSNATFQLLAAFAVVAVFLPVKQGFYFSPVAGSIVPVLILGIINTGIGCLLYFSAIQDLGAHSVAIIGYLEPLSAVVMSAVFMHERLFPLQYAGAFLILGGAAFGEISGMKRMSYK